MRKVLTFQIMDTSPEQTHAIEEYGIYEYDKDSIEKGKEVPVKQDDHCMDAIRYMVMGFWSKIKRWLPVLDDEDDLEGVNSV